MLSIGIFVPFFMFKNDFGYYFHESFSLLFCLCFYVPDVILYSANICCCLLFSHIVLFCLPSTSLFFYQVVVDHFVSI